MLDSFNSLSFVTTLYQNKQEEKNEKWNKESAKIVEI
jgi:hypothetical protein